MKKPLLILGIIAIVAVGSVFLVYSLNSDQAELEPAPDLFGANVRGPSVGVAGAGNTLELTLLSGEEVEVPNFTRVNQPGWAGTSGYVVAGDTSDSFLIMYIPYPINGEATQASFMISLLSKPLAEARLEAESALLETLKLKEYQLCALDVDVFTLDEVDSRLTGQDLGLSFCPNAVPLP